MTFQSTVNIFPSLGIPGEIYDTGPVRAEPFILNSITNPNIFGYAFSVSAEGVAVVGNPGGTNVFAGYLVNPKNSALYGVGGDPLAPTLILPDQNIGQILSMGSIIVSLPIPALATVINIGDLIVYNNVTGALQSISPATALPVGFSPGYAVVDRFTPNTAVATGTFGLAVIRVTTTPKIPA